MNEVLKKYPIEKVRAQFPACDRVYKGKNVAYFEAAGAPQVVGGVIDEMRSYLSNGTAKKHAVTPTSHETEVLFAKSKEALAAFVNADVDEIAFGSNATSLMTDVARALSREWKKGDEIVVTELEHNANIDTWRVAAEDKGLIVRFIPLDTKTLTLDYSDLKTIINDKTILVAIGLGNNAVGTITDIKPVHDRAREVGAIFSVDASGGLPYFYVDFKALDIDMLFSSCYKFCGPYNGFAAIKKDLFKTIDVYRAGYGGPSVPDMLEVGTQSYTAAIGVRRAVEFYASLGAGNTLNEQIQSGYKLLGEYENALADYLRAELKKIPEIRLYQAPDDVSKSACVAFQVDGMTQEEFVGTLCEDYSIFLTEGHYLNVNTAVKCGVDKTGYFVRASFAPYSTKEEADRLITAAKEIIAAKK